MLGVEKLKTGVLLVVAFFNQAKEAAKDGFKAQDLFLFIDEAMQVQGVLQSAAEMKAELDDMDTAERQSIMDAVRENLNVEDAKAEAIVLAAFDWLAATYNTLRTVAS